MSAHSGRFKVSDPLAGGAIRGARRIGRKAAPYAALLALSVCLGSGQASAAAGELVSLLGAAAGDQVGAVAAGRALGDAIREVQSGDINVTIAIEGYFVLDAPLKFCNLTGFRLTSPRRTAVLMANSAAVTEAINACNVDRLRLDGFTVEGFAENGVLVANSRGTQIDHLTVNNTLSPRWSTAAVHLIGSSTEAYVHDNLVDGADYAGIMVDTSTDSDVSGVRIENNRVLHTCRRVMDCGAIYINDRGRRSTGIIIAGNSIEDFGPFAVAGRGIYLDDWASHSSVRNNTIMGPGQFAIQIHGGHDNRLESNTIAADSIGKVLLYEAGIGDRRAAMTENVFANNRVSRARVNDSNWPIGGADLTGDGALTVSGNSWCTGSTCNATP